MVGEALVRVVELSSNQLSRKWIVWFVETDDKALEEGRLKNVR